MNGVPVTVEAAQPTPAPSENARPEHDVLRATTRKCLFY